MVCHTNQILTPVLVELHLLTNLLLSGAMAVSYCRSVEHIHEELRSSGATPNTVITGPSW